MPELSTITELTDAELDTVAAAGHALLNVEVRLQNIDVAILNDSINNNDIAINAAILAVQRNINRQA